MYNTVVSSTRRFLQAYPVQTSVVRVLLRIRRRRLPLSSVGAFRVVTEESVFVIKEE